MENLFAFSFDELNTFNNPPSIDTPASSAEMVEEVVQDGKKFYSCAFPNCGKIFRFKSEFTRHKVIHTAQRPFNCPHLGCTKTFKREDALKNHIRIHTGELPYKCDVPGCEMSFPTKAGLRYHSLKHQGEKQWTCSFPGCGKSFLTATQLKQHENSINYHSKIAHQSQVRNEKAPEPVVQEKYKDEMIDEFFVPMTQPVGIQWEVKNQSEQEAGISPDIQENFEKMVKIILKENNAMKKRLEMCNSLMSIMQENHDLKEKLKKVEYEQVAPPPINSDDNIFSFLNF